MRHSPVPFPRFAILAAIVASGLGAVAWAQGNLAVPTPGLTQSNIVRADLVEFPANDVIAFNGTFEPGATPGPHRHPGTEIVHVIEGTGLLLQEGREPIQLRQGMTVLSEPTARGGTFAHEIRNLSTTALLKTYIVLLVDNGEPPALPAR